MKKLIALVVVVFAFAAPSAFAKNDYSCDKKFIFFVRVYCILKILINKN